tara:strand:- start:1727 stop:5401 length:3675 start_codon:yes stop_codon:yes gene_type:complete
MEKYSNYNSLLHNLNRNLKNNGGTYVKTHASPIYFKTHEDSMKKSRKNTKQSPKLKSLEATETLPNLSSFVCSSAKFVLIDAEYNMKLNLAGTYVDMYKMFIASAIQRDQKVINVIRANLEKTGIDTKIKKFFKMNLFTKAMSDNKYMIYYKFLFALCSLETIHISNSSIQQYYLKLKQFGIKIQHPLCMFPDLLAKFKDAIRNLDLHQTIRTKEHKAIPYQKTWKRTLQSNSQQGLMYPTMVKTGGAPFTFSTPHDSLSRLMENIAEPKHDFGGSRSKVYQIFSGKYKGQYLGDYPHGDKENDIKGVNEVLNKSNYKFTHVLDKLLKRDILSLLESGDMEPNMFARLHSIQELAFENVDEAYLGGLNYFKFEPENLIDPNKPFEIWNFNTDNEQKQEKLTQFSALMKLLLKNANIKWYVYDTSSGMKNTSKLLQWASDNAGVSISVPLVNLWDPGSTKVGNWTNSMRNNFSRNKSMITDQGNLNDDSTSVNIYNRTYMNSTRGDSGFPKRDIFSYYQLKPSEELSYSIELNEPNDGSPIADCPIKLNSWYEGTVSDPVLLKSGLSVKMLSILMLIFDRFLKLPVPDRDLAKLDAIKVEEFSKEKLDESEDEEYNDEEYADEESPNGQTSECQVSAVMERIFTMLKEFLTTQAPITDKKIKQAIGMLLDFKKSGDWGLINWVKKWNENVYNGEHQCMLVSGDKLCALKNILMGNPTLFGSDGGTIGFYNGKKRTPTPAYIKTQLAIIRNRLPLAIFKNVGAFPMWQYDKIKVNIEAHFSTMHTLFKKHPIDLMDILFGARGFVRVYYDKVSQMIKRNVTFMEFKTEYEQLTLIVDIVDSINDICKVQMESIVNVVTGIRSSVLGVMSAAALMVPVEEGDMSASIKKQFEEAGEGELIKKMITKVAGRKYMSRSRRTNTAIQNLLKELKEDFFVDDGGSFFDCQRLSQNTRFSTSQMHMDIIPKILKCIGILEIAKCAYETVPTIYTSMINKLEKIRITSDTVMTAIDVHKIGVVVLHHFTTNNNFELELPLPERYNLRSGDKKNLSVEYLNENINELSGLIDCLHKKCKENLSTSECTTLMKFIDDSDNLSDFVKQIAAANAEIGTFAEPVGSSLSSIHSSHSAQIEQYQLTEGAGLIQRIQKYLEEANKTQPRIRRLKEIAEELEIEEIVMPTGRGRLRSDPPVVTDIDYEVAINDYIDTIELSIGIDESMAKTLNMTDVESP